MSPLGELGQNDFLAGMQLGVARHLIDPRGVARIENGLLNDDGSIYKRGGSEKLLTAAFGTGGRYVWEGHLFPGRRTFVASSSAFGVLSEAGDAVISLGGGGFTIPKVSVAFQDKLFIGGGTIYGGSRKEADYSTGTITVTNGSKVVVGSGTSWTASVDSGMLLRIAGGKIYVVAEVKSNTELVLREAYGDSSGGGKGYSLKRLETASAPYISSDFYAVAAERLLAVEGTRTLRFSEPNLSYLYEATIFPQETKVQNKHELEEGVKILGLQSIGVDKALVAHTGGVTAFSNLAKSIVDGLGNSQHRIDLLSREIILWANQGIAGYRDSLVIPAIDQVYLVNGADSPVPLNDNILPRYRERLEEGMTPGAAFTARNHYFLPILDTSGVPQDLLVCRLDRPYRSRDRTVYPWTFISAVGAQIAAGCVRHPEVVGEAPKILAAAKDGQLLDLMSFFEPDELHTEDHDGTVPLFSLTTRDYGLGNEGITRWRRIQLFYELWAAEEFEPISEGFLIPEELEEGEEDPEVEEVEPEPEPPPVGITCEVGTGIRIADLPRWDGAKWDEFSWATDVEDEFTLLEGVAPPNAGVHAVQIQNEKVWLMRPIARYTRYRIQCADPVAKLVIRGLQIFPAQTGGVRRSRVT